MRERTRLGKSVVTELRQMKEKPRVPVPAIIDTVWVLSGPGTAENPQETGIFAGRYMDRERILAGIDMVKKITATVIQKPADEITQEDIKNNGPVLLYNGEQEQNRALTEYMQTGYQQEFGESFPLPGKNVTILDLTENYTPGQMKSFITYNQTHTLSNVLIISHAPHLPRIGRYLKHYEAALPENISYYAYPVPESGEPVAAVKGEIDRIEAYAEKTTPDLAEESIALTYVA